MESNKSFYEGTAGVLANIREAQRLSTKSNKELNNLMIYGTGNGNPRYWDNLYSFKVVRKRKLLLLL